VKGTIALVTLVTSVSLTWIGISALRDEDTQKIQRAFQEALGEERGGNEG